MRVLSLLSDNVIIAYVLPANTSNVLKLCDAVVIAKFKAELNDAIAAFFMQGQYKELDMFNFCDALCIAYARAFTFEHIDASFRRADLWPLNAKCFLKKPLPRDLNDLGPLFPWRSYPACYRLSAKSMR